MKEYGGFFWPDFDRDAHPVIVEEVKRLPLYLKHLRYGESDVCVQAGGNVGVWADALSDHFKLVLSFEPSDENIECFVENLKSIEPSSVLLLPFALGQKAERIYTYQPTGELHNAGATAVQPNPEGYLWSIPLDRMMLTQSLDFLMLDVEGYELQALKGGQEWIIRDHPLISCELKGLGKAYGYEDQEVVDYLASLGYEQVDRIHRDSVFQWKG